VFVKTGDLDIRRYPIRWGEEARKQSLYFD